MFSFLLLFARASHAKWTSERKVLLATKDVPNGISHSIVLFQNFNFNLAGEREDNTFTSFFLFFVFCFFSVWIWCCVLGEIKRVLFFFFFLRTETKEHRAWRRRIVYLYECISIWMVGCKSTLYVFHADFSLSHSFSHEAKQKRGLTNDFINITRVKWTASLFLCLGDR